MADYEGGKVDGTGRTLGAVGLGLAALVGGGGFLTTMVDRAASYVGASIRGTSPFGFHGHAGYGMPAPAMAGCGGVSPVEHENIRLQIENANLHTNARVTVLEKELEFERSNRKRDDEGIVKFITAHYVPGKLVMPATEVMTITPLEPAASA